MKKPILNISVESNCVTFTNIDKDKTASILHEEMHLFITNRAHLFALKNNITDGTKFAATCIVVYNNFIEIASKDCTGIFFEFLLDFTAENDLLYEMISDFLFAYTDDSYFLKRRSELLESADQIYNYAKAIIDDKDIAIKFKRIICKLERLVI